MELIDNRNAVEWSLARAASRFSQDFSQTTQSIERLEVELANAKALAKWYAEQLRQIKAHQKANGFQVEE